MDESTKAQGLFMFITVGIIITGKRDRRNQLHCGRSQSDFCEGRAQRSSQWLMDVSQVPYVCTQLSTFK